MGTRSGELRETLIEAIDAVRHGKLGPNEGKAIAALATQINASLLVEIGLRRHELEWKQKLPLGVAELGESRVLTVEQE